MTDSRGEVSLSVALEGLRAELESAWAESADKAIRFRAREVTLTVEAVARREVDASGKVRWWVIEGGVGGRSERETTQTLVLTLEPGLYDEGSYVGPLDVAADQSRPEG
jgi:Trypsin-co-occurring domain 2